VGLIAITTTLLEGAKKKKILVFEERQAQQITKMILVRLLFGEHKSA
jgi:hypothetical protein